MTSKGENKSKNSKRNISLKNIFGVFLKTGRNRIILSIACGILIFLTISSLFMFLLSYRYAIFIDYTEQQNPWYADTEVTTASAKIRSGVPSLDSNLYNNLTYDFKRLVYTLIPDAIINDYTMGVSAEVYYESQDPETIGLLLNNEIMTFDDYAFSLLNQCLVNGRMPENPNEVLFHNKWDYASTEVNYSIPLRAVKSLAAPTINVTVVGVVENVTSTFRNNGASSDIFSWEVDYFEFDDYFAVDTFFFEKQAMLDYLNSFELYSGIWRYFIDMDVDLSLLNLNEINSIINRFPRADDLPISFVIQYYVDVAPDIRQKLINFAIFWSDEISRIISIMAPFIFILGLISIITLSIGTRELESTFRNMKIYGLEYKIIRKLVLLENLLFSSLSVVFGLGAGMMIGYFSKYMIDEPPPRFIISSLGEPILYILVIVFLTLFFAGSFFVENGIAREAAKITADQYKAKRKKINQLLSTNEFRFFIITLIFSSVSVGIYLIFNYTVPTTIYSNFSIQVLIWFMVSISAALIIAFVLLLVARLISLFWSLISNLLWKNKMNVLTLSIKQMAVNRREYQIAIIGGLIFGLGFLPGLVMEKSVDYHLANEAAIGTGCSYVLLDNWFDPYNSKIAALNVMPEIELFTTVKIYQAINYNNYLYYPSAFSITFLSIENPINFTSIIDSTLVNQSTTRVSDINFLKWNFTVLTNTDYAVKRGLTPGEKFWSTDFTRGSRKIEITYVNSFDYFPLVHLVEKKLFYSNLDKFAYVCNNFTTEALTDAMDWDTTITIASYKIVKPVNESVIPTLLTKLSDNGIDYLLPDQYYNSLEMNVSEFAKKMLVFNSVLSAFTLILIGYFTAMRIYRERVRIIESIYRSGTMKEQIWASFSIEIVLTILFPTIISAFAFLPLLKTIATFFLNVQAIYYPFQIWLPWWTIVLTIVGAILATLIGWFLGIIPLVRRYRPVKQE